MVSCIMPTPGKAFSVEFPDNFVLAEDGIAYVAGANTLYRVNQNESENILVTLRSKGLRPLSLEEPGWTMACRMLAQMEVYWHL